MNMFSILMKNLKMRPITKRLPSEVPRPKNFRGPVKIQEEKCIGCGMCAYVCVSSAIEVKDHRDHSEWTYSPGRCTFCSRCVAICPFQALGMEGQSASPHAPGEVSDEVHRMAYPSCPECGRPTPPVREALIAALFKEVTPEASRRIHLCRRCRQREAQRRLASTSSNKSGEGEIHGP